MSRPRLGITIGGVYGEATVLGEGPRDDEGHIRYRVRCACGAVRLSTAHQIKTGQGLSCRDCLKRQARERYVARHTGRVIGSWRVEGPAPVQDGPSTLFTCRCLRCGNTSPKTIGQITQGHGAGCAKCTPDYHFTIAGPVAEGVLPDGTRFLVDTDMIPAVSALWWHYDGHDGYVVSAPDRRHDIRLHRFVLGVTDPQVTVDHINRVRTDCRRCNLRPVTAHQNSMNTSRQKNNRSGHLGVAVLRDGPDPLYRASIGFNDRKITLLVSGDPVECAQAYNHAADLLYGRYRGHVNDVPDAPRWIRRIVEDKCRPYMQAAAEARRPRPLTTPTRPPRNPRRRNTRQATPRRKENHTP